MFIPLEDLECSIDLYVICCMLLSGIIDLLKGRFNFVVVFEDLLGDWKI